MTENMNGHIFTVHFCLLFVASLVCCGVYYLMVTIIASYAIAMFACSDGLAGLATSIFMVAAVAGRLVSGHITSSGYLRAAIATMVLMLAACLCYLITPASYGLLLMVRLVHGFAFGVSGTMLQVLAMEAMPVERLGEGVGYFTLSATLGTALGPMVGMFVVSGFDYNALFLVCSAVVAAGLVALLMASRRCGQSSSSSRDASRKAKDVSEPMASKPGASKSSVEVEDSFRNADAAISDFEALTPCDADVAESTTVNAPHSAKPVEGDSARISIYSLIDKGTWRFSFFTLLLGIAYAPLNAFLYNYGAQLGLGDAVPFVFLVYAAVLLVSRPVAGRLLDRHGRNVVLIPSIICMGIGLVVCAFAQNAAMLISVGIFMALGFGTSLSAAQAAVTKMVGAKDSSMAVATLFVFADAGNALGPFLLGFVATAWNYSVMYAACAGLAALCLVYYLWQTRKAK